MTNETKHPPEPWHVGDGKASIIVYSNEGWAVCDTKVYHGKTNGKMADAAARRIVACVNYCQGVSTETLEKLDVQMAVKRDELAAALRYYAAIKGPAGEPAREALAKVKS